MLLLVPSHKYDPEGSSKSTISSRVLVVLPPDTDLSSNIIVPDTAITTTLGTNDTMDTINNSSTSLFSNHTAKSFDPPKNTRDDLGILKPSGTSDHQFHLHHQFTQPLTIHRSPNRESERLNRSRRHSHSGLVDSGYGISNLSLPRSRPRQSSRTLRVLRNAFRQARKDQSPLLTSVSVVAGCAMSRLSPDLEDDDKDPSRIAGMPVSVIQNTPHNSITVIDQSMTSISTYQKGARLSTFGPFNDLDVGDGRKADQEQDSYLTTPGTSLKSIATTASKRHPRISAEIMDGDVDGDLDWKGNPTRSFATNSMVTSGADSKSLVSVSRNKEGTRKHGYQDADQDCDFDSDMNLILGMASDMELIMPKFDDEYLEDLKNDPVLTMPCRRSSTVPTASPSTPCVASVESNQHVESLPAAALGVLASGVQGRSPHVSQQTGHPSQCPNLPDHSNANRDLSTIECSDCDSARHQRTSTMDMDSSVMKSSTYSPSPSISSETQKGSLSSTLSSSTINNERKNNGPIYFKPKYYSVSRQSHIGEHSQKDWNTTTTGELTFDSSGSTGMSAGPPFSLQRRTALSGHHIFRTQDPLQFPNMDGDTMMTVSNLSLVTANMNVLTPQEVQEDYYARRNLRMYQQRQRRRSSAIGALGGHSGTGVLPFRTEGFSPLARRSSSSDIQYFEKPVVPAIGASPLPASYYLPPSAFRTEADVAAEQEAERKRKEQEEEFKDSFLVFPSPVLS